MSTLHRGGGGGGKGNLNAIQIFCLTISNLPSDEWQAKTAALKQLMRTITQIVNPNSAHDDDCSVMSEDSRSVHVLKNIESSLTSPRRGGGKPRTNHSNRVLLPPSMRDTGLKRSSSRDSLTSLASEATGCSMSVASIRPKMIIPKSEIMLQPQSLRQLHTPFRILLTDLRTLVVKSVCYNIAKLTKLVGDNARLLMTDIMPDILAVYSQTVKVMHGFAMQAMSAVIQHCKFRGGITILIREGKGNKSKVVRSICMKYLQQILDTWPHQFLASDIENIGQSLVNSLIDPAQSVRMEGRKAFLHSYFRNYPESWYKIVHSPEGVLANDTRLKKSILANSVALASESKGTKTTTTTSSKSLHATNNKKNIKNNENGITNTITLSSSTFAVEAAAHHSKQVNSAISSSTSLSSSGIPSSNPFHQLARQTPSNRRLNSSARRRAIRDELHHKAACSIQAVVRGTSTRKKIRQICLSSQENSNNSIRMIATSNNPFNLSSSAIALGVTPERISSSIRQQTDISPLASPDLVPNNNGYKVSNTRNLSSMRSTALRSTNIKPQPLRAKSCNNYSRRQQQQRENNAPPPVTRALFNDQENIISTDDDDNNNDSTDSFLASPMIKQDEHINSKNINNSKTRRESSIMFQQKLDQQDHDSMINISHSILSLHRKHMSDLMDALREEMDLISIFESSILEDSKPKNRVKQNNGSINKNRLTEEQILKYYEKVLNCLDSRNDMINNVKQKLEQLSEGSDLV